MCQENNCGKHFSSNLMTTRLQSRVEHGGVFREPSYRRSNFSNRCILTPTRQVRQVSTADFFTAIGFRLSGPQASWRMNSGDTRVYPLGWRTRQLTVWFKVYTRHWTIDRDKLSTALRKVKECEHILRCPPGLLLKSFSQFSNVIWRVRNWTWLIWIIGRQLF